MVDIPAELLFIFIVAPLPTSSKLMRVRLAGSGSCDLGGQFVLGTLVSALLPCSCNACGPVTTSLLPGLHPRWTYPVKPVQGAETEARPGTERAWCLPPAAVNPLRIH